MGLGAYAIERTALGSFANLQRGYAAIAEAAYRAMLIRDTAGFKARPGYAPNVTPGESGTMYDETSVLNITQESHISTYTPPIGAPALSGIGTKDDPYVIQQVRWNVIAGATTFNWNDPNADYYIELRNCALINANGSGKNINVNISPQSEQIAALYLNNSRTRNTTTGVRQLNIEQGLVECRRHKFDYNQSNSAASGICFLQGGVNSRLLIEDSLWASPSGTAAPLIGADTNDGFIVDIRRFTLEPTANLISAIGAVGTIRVRQIKAPNGAQMILLGPTAKDIEYLGMNDCDWICADALYQAIQCHSSGQNYHTIRAGDIDDCRFTQNHAGGNVRMITIGSLTPGDQTPNGVVFRRSRFVKDSTQTAPGNEVVEFFGADNCGVEECWIEGGGEDGYEFHTCGGGNFVRRSGGTNVGGQMVDFYKSKDGSSEHGWNIIQDVHGDCGVMHDEAGASEAVSITDHAKVAIQGIHVDNSASANGRGLIEIIEDGSLPAPNQIRIFGQLTKSKYCAGGNQIHIDDNAGSDITGIWDAEGRTNILRLANI